MPLKSFLISLAVCMLFVGSRARADECSDALIAESCTCRSASSSEHSQLHGSDKGSSGHQSSVAKVAETQVAKHTKSTVAPIHKAVLAK